MTGNWSWSEAEFSRSYMPEVCNGWLSVTTPKVGAELAQVGLSLFGESGASGSKWERFFTLCPWLNGFKATFFNSLIVSKTSSRKGVEYVGSIFSPAVWKYFICLHIEHLLDDLERLFPSMLPSYVWDACTR